MYHSRIARFFARLVVTNLKSAFALRASFWLQMIFMILNNVTFFVFWWVFFGKVGNVGGFELSHMQALFGVCASGFGLMQALLGGVRHLGRLIDEGDLDPLLSQPKPALLYAVGMRSAPSGFGDFISGVGFLAISGHVSGQNLPHTVLAITTCCLTFTASGVLFFSLAFWLRRSETLARQLWDITLTFALYPDPLFTGGLRLLLYTLIPAGIVAYLPLQLVTHPTWSVMAWVLSATAIYGFVALAVFHYGLRRYCSGSRFGTFG